MNGGKRARVTYLRKDEMRTVLALGVVFAGAAAWVAFGGGNAEAGEAFTCTVASITDGDTLRCVEEGSDGRAIRVRVSGIAARERDGSCSAGHPCPNASAEASTGALERLAAGETLSCRAVGPNYGRVAAFCANSSGVDLSCAMVQGGYAAKWDRYWGRAPMPMKDQRVIFWSAGLFLSLAILFVHLFSRL